METREGQGRESGREKESEMVGMYKVGKSDPLTCGVWNSDLDYNSLGSLITMATKLHIVIKVQWVKQWKQRITRNGEER